MKFSIVTPTLNQPEWLRLCAASVADQLVGGHGLEIEHIIQDGGAGEAPVLSAATGGAGYELRHFRERDSGMYDALRRGVERASGEIIGHLNSDEQYLPGALAAVAEWFEQHPEAEMVFGDAVMVGSDGRYLSSRYVSVPDPLHMRLTGNLTVFTAATFFRRRMLERGVVYDPEWRVVGDAEWICRLVEAGVPMAVRRGYLAAFTWNPHILSNTARGDAERARLYRSVPAHLRWLKIPLTIQNRLGRLFRGAYHLKPHNYAIYTRAEPSRRTEFRVEKPTYRWPARSEGDVL